MAAPEDDLRALRDRASIRDVLVRYFHGADRADAALVGTCFTEQVDFQLEGRPRAQGVDTLLAQMAVLRKLPEAEWTVTTHFMGSLWFRHLDAASAHTETYAFAFLVAPAAGVETVRMRSLRYVDRFVRRDDGWKIASRLHTLDWSCEVPCDFARAFAQRQTQLPSDQGL